MKQETESEVPKDLSSLIDISINSNARLKQLEIFSYVLFGSGLFLTLLFFINIDIIAPDSRVLIFAASLLITGVTLFVFGKILGYRIAIIKLRMILSTSEKLMLKSIKDNEGVDNVKIKALITEVLALLWGFQP